MSKISVIQIIVGTVVCGGFLALVLFVSSSHGVVASTKPATIRSKIVTWKDASSHKAEWGEMRTYFRGKTLGTKDAFAAVAVVEPDKSVHRAHRHVEEEYLVINEGSGVWQLGDKTFPARKGDMLYVEPWIYHGLTNTGDKPLQFTVIKFSSKGVKLPMRPDSRKDEL
ncbi:MAG: cupin domain-containing protein [Planctomycetota bacterium]